jgi:HlyD family secretion protein
MKRNAIAPQVCDFQEDAVALEYARPPWLVGIVYAFIIAGIALVTVWAFVFEVDRVVSADGKLITVRPNIVMKPLERIVVRKVCVRVGEIVKKDQVLIKLDPEFSKADEERLSFQSDSFSVHADRLRSELLGKDFKAPAAETDDYRRQKVIFDERRRFYKEKIVFYDENIARLETILATRLKNLSKQTERLEALIRLEGLYEKAYDKHGIALKDLIELQIQRMEFEGSQDTMEGQIAESKHDLLSARAEKNTFLNQWREDIAKELVNVERELDSVQQQLNKARRNMALTELKAPCDAMVHEIAAYQEGSAVREAEAVITLVPLGVDIEAVVNVDPKDIGWLKVGNEAKVKLGAYPFQRYGTLNGKLRTISEDTFSEQQGALGGSRSFYHVQLALSGRLLPRAGEYRLVPGMQVTAEIKVGRRRIIEYLTDPLIKALDESFKEP